MGAIRHGHVKKVQETVTELSDTERSALRFKLENLWNEVDLIVKNAKSDQLDVERQEREFKAFDVFQKMPVASGDNAKTQALIAQVKKSAATFGLTVSSAKVVEATKPDQPVPASVFTDIPDFKLTDDQIAQKVRLQIVVTGSKEQLQKWMDHWDDPYLEWDPEAMTSFPEALPQGQWKIHAQAYRFRDIRYPKLVPRDPVEVLPAWARTNPALFQQREPLLWSYVEQTHAMLPRALPQFELRRQFLLNSARMEFFIEKFRSSS